jgi:UrcA family protein
MHAHPPSSTWDLPEILNLKEGFTLSRLGSFRAAGLLLTAATFGSGAAAETPTPGLLVPLHVIEPAQWVVHTSGFERGGEQSFRVSYSDLDLSKAIGVSELYERLQHASEKVCRLKTRSRSNSEKYLCIRGALAKAVAEVNLLSLNELHSG